jgi:two-component system OmpR family sensor kinase
MRSAATTRSQRPARWRSPASWPLRTRIVAIMISLLTVLGLVVGGTAELYLYKSLHQQIDTDLVELSNRLRGGFGGKGFSPPGKPDNSSNGSKPPSSLRENSIMVSVTSDGTITGFRVVGTQGSPDNDFEGLSATATDAIRSEVPKTGDAADVSLGGDLPEYRVMATVKSDGSIQYIGLPLDEVNSTLVTVAMFTDRC